MDTGRSAICFLLLMSCPVLAYPDIVPVLSKLSHTQRGLSNGTFTSSRIPFLLGPPSTESVHPPALFWLPGLTAKPEPRQATSQPHLRHLLVASSRPQNWAIHRSKPGSAEGLACPTQLEDQILQQLKSGAFSKQDPGAINLSFYLP